MRTKLASDYKAYKVTEAATLVSAKGKTTYEAEVSKGGKSPDVLFNGNGSLTKKQAPVPAELHAGCTRAARSNSPMAFTTRPTPWPR